MKYIMPLFALMLVACSSCAAVTAAVNRSKYVDEPTYVEYESSVRILVSCADGGTVIGSGTTVSADTVLTAKHVVEGCDDSGGAILMRVVTQDDEEHTMLLDRKMDGQDVATMIAMEDAPFTVFPKVATTLPLIGETVCWVGGDGDPDMNDLRKCAEWTGYQYKLKIGDMYFLAGKPAPGNSGSGVFNSRGELLGVLNVGDWDPRHDFMTGITVFEVWKTLLPY